MVRLGMTGTVQTRVDAALSSTGDRDRTLARLRSMPDASASEVRLTDVDPRDDGLGVVLAEAQRAMRPGARLCAWPRRGAGRASWRRLHAALLHYFDPALNPGEPLVLPYRLVTRPRPETGLCVERRRRQHTSGHFDELAPTYWHELPDHIQEHFLAQKLAPLDDMVQREPGLRLGLDVGCGVGQYARILGRRRGVRIVGVDVSPGALVRANQDRAPGHAFAAADSLRLPFRDGTFDFAYTVNVLHHMKRGEQERALQEIHRVLRPGAPLLVQEMNQRNPLFRWYLRHVYPRTRRIDRGDEEYVHPDRLPLGAPFRTEAVRHFTFTPDFLPRIALRPMRRLERALEAGPLGPYSIHYAARLRRVDEAGPGQGSP